MRIEHVALNVSDLESTKNSLWDRGNWNFHWSSGDKTV